jgi:hypothetical protein
MVHQYEKSVKDSVKEAHLHHQMAPDVEETSAPPSTSQKVSAAQSHHNLFTAE